MTNYHELSYEHHPQEDLEPDRTHDIIHEARLAAIRLINGFCSEIEQVLSRPNCKVEDVAARFYSLCFAIGATCIGGGFNDRTS